MLPARLWPSVAFKTANLIKLHGKGNKWVQKGSATGPSSQFGTQQKIPRLREGPGRNDFHRGPLTSWLSKKASIFIWMLTVQFVGMWLPIGPWQPRVSLNASTIIS